MKPYQVLWVSAVLGVQMTGFGLRAEETNTVELIQQLQKRIEELEQKVKSLEQGKEAEQSAKDAQAKQRLEELDQKLKNLQHQQELEEQAAEAKAREAPRISIGEQGFSLGSSNGDFLVQLKGVLQVDSRTFFQDAGTVGNDGILLRRARPMLQGTVYRDFDFLFVPDFGGTSGPQIFDAYVNYRYNPALQLQAGKFKSPIGLEQLQADRDILFNERALVTDLVPNRDIGFELHGELFEGIASYAAGVFNGVGDARNSSNADFEDNKAGEGRLFLLPFKKLSAPALRGFGFGVSGSYEHMQTTNTAGLPATTGGTLPGFTTDGQQQFFAYNPTNKAVVLADGDHWRVSPQGYYFYGPFGFLGEYVVSEQKVTRTGIGPQPSARLGNTAWQITGSWVLTGEDAAFAGGVVPRKPFNPLEGRWGAWQLVGRYAELHADPEAFPLFSDPATSARAAKAWSVGLNWWLNRNLRVATSFSHTTFTGGGGAGTTPPASVTRKDENVLFTRLQLAF